MLEKIKNTIYCGDWIEWLKKLPDGIFHCCITSPPYWGQRDYGCAGQLGLEKTPEEHIEKLVEGFREVRRVLRDDGVLWVNYGDKYGTGKGTCNNPGGGDDSFAGTRIKKEAFAYPLDRGNISDLKKKILNSISTQ